MSMRVLVFMILAALHVRAAAAEDTRAQSAFLDERSCASAGKFSLEQCANAAANARAEFEEKAPRFSTREACERAFRRGGCSIGLSGAEGWSGKRPGIYFTPRQDGFRVMATLGRGMTVVPLVAGAGIGFSPRTIARRDTRIDPKLAAFASKAWGQRAAHSDFGGSGVPAEALDKPSATGERGPLPPPPPVDPNFNCAAFLEPGGNSQDGCYPAPVRRQ